MTTLARVNMAAREFVGDLEQRVGGKRKLYVISSIVALIVLVLLVRSFVGAGKTTPAPPPRPVAVAKVITRDVPLYQDEIGTCAASESVQVQAQVSGQIVARHFKDGDDVKKGDLLFTIDTRPYQAALEQAQGQLAQAKAQFTIDEVTLQRQRELRAKNVISQQELDMAQWTANADEAKVKSAEGAVAAAQVNLDYCTIRSPIDGRIGLRQVDVGNTVSSGSNGAVLVTIDNLDPIYTDFTVAEPDLPLVRQYLGNPESESADRRRRGQYPARAKANFILLPTPFSREQERCRRGR